MKLPEGHADSWHVCAGLLLLLSACRNALAYTLFAEGIPYIYYGTEQGYTVDREPLWHSGYSREHPLWLFLRISLAYRKEAKVRSLDECCPAFLLPASVALADHSASLDLDHA